MAGLNKVMLIGNTVADGELRYTASGTAVLNFRMAVNDRKEATFFSIAYMGETAEKVAQYVTKGKLVYVEGRLNNRQWTDDKNQKHERTEVVASNLTLLGGRDE